MRRRDDLKHGGHTDRIRAQRAEHPDFRRCFELRAVHAAVHAAVQLEAAVCGGLHGLFAQRAVVCECHIREARAECRIVRAGERALARHVDVVGDEHEVPRVIAGVDAARGIRHDKRLHAQLFEHIDRVRHLVRRIALVAVQTALHTDNAAACQRAADHAAGMVGRGGYLEVRNIAVGHIDRIFHLIGQRADARAEHERDLGHERQVFSEIRCGFHYICLGKHSLSSPLTDGAGWHPCASAFLPLPFRCRWS